MSNMILAYGNLIDEATLSGGFSYPSLPLANLQDERLGKVWRTVDTLTASTWFDIDLGSPRLLRTIAMANHNLSLTALYRIRFGDDPTFATVTDDSGWLNVWPEIYPFGEVPWGSESWWDGRLSATEAAAYTATLVRVLASTMLGRYIRVEFDDQTNDAGYVQGGRLFVADGWQPVRNMVYGANIGWLDRNSFQEAISGAEYGTKRRSPRLARFELPAMTESEAMAQAFEIQRSVGTLGEVLYMWNPDDTVHAIRRQFLGRLRVLSQIENAAPDRWRSPFEIKERL